MLTIKFYYFKVEFKYLRYIAETINNFKINHYSTNKHDCCELFYKQIHSLKITNYEILKRYIKIKLANSLSNC